MTRPLFGPGPAGRKTASRVLQSLGLAVALVVPPSAQELEPRAYQPSPAGITLFSIGYGYSTGALIFDPTLLITNAEARISSMAVGVGRVFAFKGRAVAATAVLPWAWGDASGEASGQAQRVSRAGLTDMRFKVSVNLAGSPGVTARDFATARRRRVVGGSLTVLAPTGEYDRTKLVNLGSHRWAFKPEIGLSIPRGAWDFDVYGAVWLFTTNDEYYPGSSRRSQDPISAFQAHVAYTIRPRLWVAADATWYGGGEVRVDEGEPFVPYRNTRIGATLALPVGARQAIKVAWSTGLRAQSGSDFRTIAVAWQTAWARTR